MVSSTHSAAQGRESPAAAHTSSNKRLTPFEKDTRNYGKAGATLIGGARALSDLAGTQCSFSPKAVGKAAAVAAGASAASSASAHGTAGGIGDVISATGQAIEDFGDDVVDASKKVVAEAAAAYGAVAEMVGTVAGAVSEVSNTVSHWTSDVVDDVADLAGAVVESATDVADDVAGYSLMLMAL